MVTILMMSAKKVNPGLRERKIFLKKGYDVIILVSDVTNKIFSLESNYTIDVVTWPKFGNSRISMREVIITSINKNLTRKTAFFEVWSWFKFNNLGLTLGTNLKFYTSVAKGLKLKVRKFWGLTRTVAEVTGKKLVGDLFCPPHPILNKVKSNSDYYKSCF